MSGRVPHLNQQWWRNSATSRVMVLTQGGHEKDTPPPSLPCPPGSVWGLILAKAKQRPVSKRAGLMPSIEAPQNGGRRHKKRITLLGNQQCTKQSKSLFKVRF